MIQVVGQFLAQPGTPSPTRGDGRLGRATAFARSFRIAAFTRPHCISCFLVLAKSESRVTSQCSLGAHGSGPRRLSPDFGPIIR